ncbi:DUF6705 family protein [Nonlabens sp.]|uniref:DUF6705 family protein n=1 Tax=Nonlabens sp. TaxID=1888209 RepID=UPI003F69B320
MKNVLLILMICLGLYSCKAQVYPMERDDYVSFDSGISFKDMNNNLDKFQGTWEYQDSTSKLTVILQKIEDYEVGNALSDVIVGNYIYEENGVEIINTLTNPAVSQGSRDMYHIEMYGFRNSSKIVGDFEDPVRSKWTGYTLYLTYNAPTRANSQPQLTWNVQIHEFYNPNGDVDAEQALRVPYLLTLTKI